MLLTCVNTAMSLQAWLMVTLMRVCRGWEPSSASISQDTPTHSSSQAIATFLQRKAVTLIQTILQTKQ